MMVVEAEVYVSRHPPSEPPAGERIALECVERAVVPRQDVGLQTRPALGDVRQQLVEARRRAVVGAARQQVRVGGGIPTEREDRPPRRQHRLPREPEVVGRVLDAVEAVCLLDAPAVPSRFENGGPRLIGDVRDGTRDGAVHEVTSPGRSARLTKYAIASGIPRNNIAARTTRRRWITPRLAEVIAEPGQRDDKGSHAEHGADDEVAVAHRRGADDDVGEQKGRRHFPREKDRKRAVAFERPRHFDDALTAPAFDAPQPQPAADCESRRGARQAPGHRIGGAKPRTKGDTGRGNQQDDRNHHQSKDHEGPDDDGEGVPRVAMRLQPRTELLQVDGRDRDPLPEHQQQARRDDERRRAKPHDRTAGTHAGHPGR